VAGEVRRDPSTAALAVRLLGPSLSDDKKKQIPPLRCGMTSEGTGNGKGKSDAGILRCAQNDKQKGKGKYGDSGFARMTTSKWDD